LLLFVYILRVGGDCLTQPIDGRFIHNSNGSSQGLPPKGFERKFDFSQDSTVQPREAKPDLAKPDLSEFAGGAAEYSTMG
jgi:hypothetical protein